MTKFQHIIRELEAECYVDDWDNDGSRGVPVKLWLEAQHAYDSTIDLGVEPFLSPGDASVHLSWSVKDGQFLLEIGLEQCWISYRNPGEDQYWHLGGDLQKAISEAKKWLSSVSNKKSES